MTLEQLTSNLISYPTYTGNTQGLTDCADFIISYILKQLPHDKATIVWNNNIPSVFVRSKDTMEVDITLHGHIDVVKREESGQFNARIEGDKLYGRGSGDMKGADSVLIETYLWIRQNYPDITVALLLGGDEESGGFHGTLPLVKQGLSTKILINLDGGYGEKITLGEKGILSLKLTCDGEQNLVTYPWRGASAFDNLRKAIQVIEKQFTELDKVSEEDNWHSTFAIKYVSTPPEGASTTPNKAELTGTLCYVEDISCKEHFAKIQDAVQEYGQLELQFSAEPVVISENSEAIRLFSEAFLEVNGEVDYVRENGSSDARFFGSQAQHILISKPIGGNIEIDDEWVSISSLHRLFEIIKRTVTKSVESHIFE